MRAGFSRMSRTNSAPSPHNPHRGWVPASVVRNTDILRDAINPVEPTTNIARTSWDVAFDIADDPDGATAGSSTLARGSAKG